MLPWSLEHQHEPNYLYKILILNDTARSKCAIQAGLTTLNVLACYITIITFPGLWSH